MENDRSDIACIIAEWWHNQKVKRSKQSYEDFVSHHKFDPDLELIDSSITIEITMRVVSLDPMKLEEEGQRLVINKPGGGKIIIKNRNGKESLSKARKEANQEIIKITGKEKGCCTYCYHEDYYVENFGRSENGGDIIMNRRRCTNLSEFAQDYFKRNCKFTLSKEEIPPIEGCPFWSKIKAIKNESK